MNLQKLQRSFEQRLLKFYPTEEVGSFFRMLAEAWLGYSRMEVSLNSDVEVAPEKLILFNQAIDRLLDFEPIQYILGFTEFYGLQLKVTPDTLIPRPETEELVDWIIKDLKVEERHEGVRILDIGTGSGCIAVTLASNIPSARITALDISEKALEIAKTNAQAHGVKVDFMQQDVLFNQHLSSTFDIIVSNPPYVRDIEKPDMQPNVLKYEPPIALFVSEDDPLLFYRAIVRMAKNHLSREGSLYFEINEYLGDAMIRLMNDEGVTNLYLTKDFRGKDRMLKCTLSE